MKNMNCYQVLNRSNNPASQGEYDDQAIFKTMSQAKEWVKYLNNDIGLDEKFTIKEMLLIEMIV